MSMTPKEQATHDLIVKTLGEEGHGRYAEYFNLFDLHLFNNEDMGGTDENPVIAFMVPSRGVVYLNKDITDLNTVTFLMRHEMLHEYLKHDPRAKVFFRKLQGLSDDENPNISPDLHQITNVAADWELSKFYGPERDFNQAKAIKFKDKYLQGLVLELDKPEWLNLTYEELIQKLIKSKGQLQDFLKQTGMNNGSKKGQKATELRRQAQKLRDQISEMGDGEEGEESSDSGDGEESSDLGDSSSPKSGSSNTKGDTFSQGDSDSQANSQDSSDSASGPIKPGAQHAKKGDNKKEDKTTSNNKTRSQLQQEADELERQADELVKQAEDLEDDFDDRGSGLTEDPSEEKDREQKLKEIRDFFDDVKRQKDFLEETEARKRDDLSARAKRRKSLQDRVSRTELTKKIGPLRTMQQFVLDLNNTVKEQLKPEGRWVDTYTKPDRRYLGMGMLRPGKIPAVPQKHLPTFYVYYDISGSFSDPRKYQAAADAVHTIQEKYEKRRLIKVNLFYHESGGTVFRDREEKHEVGKNLVQHIRDTNPDNVIIITDTDPDWSCNVSYIAKVKGVVFMLFPFNETSSVLAAHVTGKVNRYYDLNSSGISKMKKENLELSNKENFKEKVKESMEEIKVYQVFLDSEDPEYLGEVEASSVEEAQDQARSKFGSYEVDKLILVDPNTGDETPVLEVCDYCGSSEGVHYDVEHGHVCDKCMSGFAQESNYELQDVDEDLSLFPNFYADKAWELNQIISHMNDEEAYFGSWLYIWPDGETEEDCRADFNDKDSYLELEELFKKIYKRYHSGGLYHLKDEGISESEWKKIVDDAHKWDKELGLNPIADLTK